MLDWQLISLALIQAVTEFLPVSSSAHLLLPSIFWGWQDQGLAFDVAVHFGSLLAVLLYMRKILCGAIIDFVRTPFVMNSHNLLWYLLLATLPVVVVGYFGRHWIEEYARNIYVISFTTIFFAVPLLLADQNKGLRRLQELNIKNVLFIGCMQAVALIPGVSRSGITITAALALGFRRDEALRFAFLLAIPVITAATTLKIWDLYQAETIIIWQPLIQAIALSAIVSWVCIDLLLRWVQTIGMLPFVIYRLILGLLLFSII